jgi:hypothetical protein
MKSQYRSRCVARYLRSSELEAEKSKRKTSLQQALQSASSWEASLQRTRRGCWTCSDSALSSSKFKKWPLAP